MRNFASGSSHVDLQDDLRKQIVSAGSASGAGRRGSALAAPSATPVRCYLKVDTGGYVVGGARAPAESGPLSLVQNVLGQINLYI